MIRDRKSIYGDEVCVRVALLGTERNPNCTPQFLAARKTGSIGFVNSHADIFGKPGSFEFRGLGALFPMFSTGNRPISNKTQI